MTDNACPTASRSGESPIGTALVAFCDGRLPARFWDKCTPEPNSGCWLWHGAILPNGYGQLFWDGGRILAHRLSYQSLAGAIADVLTIDHLCRVRCCVNPSHLEAVTHRENVLRGTSPTATNAAQTHCSYGHEFTIENTYLRGGRRICRVCCRRRSREKLERRRQQNGGVS